VKNRLFRLCISFFILFIIIKNTNIDLSSIFSLIKKPLFLIYAIPIPLFIIPLIGNKRWKIFLKIQGINGRLFLLIKLYFMSIFFGILLPSSMGFDAVRIYMIEKRNKQKIGAGGASVFVDRLIGFFLLSLLGVIGAWVAQNHGVSSNVLFTALFINFFVISLFFVLRNKSLYSCVTSYLLKIKRRKKIIEYLTLAYSAINSFPLKKVILWTVPLILLGQLSTIFCGFLIFKAFAIDLPFFFHLTFLPLISIISIIPVSISGFGLREGGFVYFYGLFGVDSNISFFVSLLYYFVLMMIPAFIGMLLYLFGSDQIKSIKNELKQINDR